MAKQRNWTRKALKWIARVEHRRDVRREHRRMMTEVRRRQAIIRAGIRANAPE